MPTNRNFWQRFLDGVELVVSSFRAGRGDPNAWESTIKKFEVMDQRQPPEMNPIVFVGSSSFTFWSSLEQDMAPLPVLNRGFGGSRMRDVVQYIDRIVLPYRPRAIILFAGANDIAYNKPDQSHLIFEGYLEFVEQIKTALPESIIYFIAITPTPARWKYWPVAIEANLLVQEYTQSRPNLHFIDFTNQLLDANGKPDRSLYKFDRLHPNARGYALWKASIKPRLESEISFDA